MNRKFLFPGIEIFVLTIGYKTGLNKIIIIRELEYYKDRFILIIPKSLSYVTVKKESNKYCNKFKNPLPFLLILVFSDK